VEYPLVTVFTLIYNTNPRYVIEAIESVRANSYPNLQHIIIDDCSPDPEPKRVVKQWVKDNDYLCEFYEHEVNYGVTKTLNHVLELAKGKYFFGCSDDILLKNRIYSDVQILENIDPSYAIIHSKTEIIDKESRLVQKLFTTKKMPADNDYFEQLLTGNFICAPSVTMVTNIIKKVGGYNESLLFEDYDMWLRLSKLGYKFKFLDQINTQYRIHDESMSNNQKIISEMRKIVQMHIKENKHIYLYHDYQLIHKHNILNTIQVFCSFVSLLKIGKFKFIYLKCLLNKLFLNYE
jgi:GT2 family glycosyltransferase